jgi:hypothetical protein
VSGAKKESKNRRVNVKGRIGKKKRMKQKNHKKNIEEKTKKPQEKNQNSLCELMKVFYMLSQIMSDFILLFFLHCQKL